MKNEEFGCAMQACRKVILHSSFLPSSCCYTFLQPKDEVYISFDILNYIIRYKTLYRSVYELHPYPFTHFNRHYHHTLTRIAYLYLSE